VDYKEASVQISSKTGVPLRPASDEDLRTLASLGAPDSIVSFYRDHEPQSEAEIGKVRLLSIADILVETRTPFPVPICIRTALSRLPPRFTAMPTVSTRVCQTAPAMRPSSS
jgi:hypothetical protein